MTDAFGPSVNMLVRDVFLGPGLAFARADLGGPGEKPRF